MAPACLHCRGAPPRLPRPGRGAPPPRTTACHRGLLPANSRASASAACPCHASRPRRHAFAGTFFPSALPLRHTRACHSPACSHVKAVSMVIAKIREAAAVGKAMDMSGLFSSFTHDLACRAVMGKHFRNKGLDMQLQELVGDTSPLIGGFNVDEFFPFLARFGVLSKVVRSKSERVRRRWDELLDGLIQEHERSEFDLASASDPKDGDDFIHVLLSVRREYGLTREQMKAILLVSIMSRLPLQLGQKHD
ncbi:hypothetical protein EJB05_38063, partial [Eragrostis curvula]